MTKKTLVPRSRRRRRYCDRNVDYDLGPVRGHGRRAHQQGGAQVDYADGSGDGQGGAGAEGRDVGVCVGGDRGVAGGGRRPGQKGDLLAKLDSTRYRANRDQAYAAQKAAASQVEMVRANLEQARRTYDRTVKLHQQELVSDEALENARTQVEALEAQLQSAVDDVGRAGANLRLTSDDVSKTVLRAPIDGIIISLKKEIGEIVMGSQLTRDVIMTVADMSKMEIVVEVDENDVPDLRLGQTARITVDAFPDQKFEGTVTQIANSAKVVGFGTQEETTSFDVTVTLRGDVSAIRPGMSATADIETATHDDVLAVPIQCLTMRDPEADPEKDLAHVRSDKLKDVVFKVADNRSALAVVTTGIASEFDMEIAGKPSPKATKWCAVRIRRSTRT
ncbi:MAG: efflux RND transporter periplasmic adaptor subunit [Deltaproteobacteria bacterium]|nr:efflux RND transporter periplasmic adaptor subunit [Deltaproteobacteria bacterium]